MALDQGIGGFADRDSYAAYLRGSHRFRAALEPAIARAEALTGWRPLLLQDALARDMDDLDQRAQPLPVAPPIVDRASMIGALYVLEGSTLGAVLLARRAAALGLGPDHGARHLARQTADSRRWCSFQALLQQPGTDAATACASARDVFALALAAFRIAPPDAPAPRIL